MTTLKGKVCLVTGAARGLGNEIVKTLIHAGAVVTGCDIRRDLLEQLKETLDGRQAAFEAIAADVSDECDAEDCIRKTVERFGKLDVLINNAAVDVTLPIDEISVTDWDRILDVNLRGPFLMSRFAIMHMKTRGSGHIVNIASTASKRAWSNASGYHASKWGLLGFSHALHAEARKDNIKVTAVISGGMRTPFLFDRFPDIDQSTLQDPANVARSIRFILEQPQDTVIPEFMVLPMKETSWP